MATSGLLTIRPITPRTKAGSGASRLRGRLASSPCPIPSPSQVALRTGPMARSGLRKPIATRLVVLFDVRNEERHDHVGDWEVYPVFRMGCVDEEKRLSCVSRFSLSLRNNRHGIRNYAGNLSQTALLASLFSKRR